MRDCPASARMATSTALRPISNLSMSMVDFIQTNTSSKPRYSPAKRKLTKHGTEFRKTSWTVTTFNEFTYENQTDNYLQTHSHLHYTYVANDKLNVNAALHYTKG